MINRTNRALAATAAMIATAFTIGAANPAHAGTIDGDTRSVVLAYADTDLSTPAGAQALASRIRRAASTVCGPLELATRNAVMACRAQAIDGAQQRVAMLKRDAGAIRLAAK